MLSKLFSSMMEIFDHMVVRSIDVMFFVDVSGRQAAHASTANHHNNKYDFMNVSFENL